MLVDDDQVRVLLRIADALQYALRVLLIRLVCGRTPVKSAVASFGILPAWIRSSLTPGRSAVALPPAAISPEALETSATVRLDMCKYAGAAASTSVCPVPA